MTALDLFLFRRWVPTSKSDFRRVFSCPTSNACLKTWSCGRPHLPANHLLTKLLFMNSCSYRESSATAFSHSSLAPQSKMVGSTRITLRIYWPRYTVRILTKKWRLCSRFSISTTMARFPQTKLVWSSATSHSTQSNPNLQRLSPKKRHALKALALQRLFQQSQARTVRPQLTRIIKHA